jgi:hypothetical protein
VTADLAILFEHPSWFEPLFAALDRRGVAYSRVGLSDHSFDPAQASPPAPVVLSRVAMSGFLREPEHGIFYAAALLDSLGARRREVVNGSPHDRDRLLQGPPALPDRSARPRNPRTRIVHRARDLLTAADGMAFPLLVKANIGGSGAGITRYASREELEQSVADGRVPDSVDKVLLLQDYVPARGGTITRIETLGGRFLYALEVESRPDSFDLCPGRRLPRAARPRRHRDARGDARARPSSAAEQIAQAAELDVGGVELVVDDRDGLPRFYDINALSNFVARPLEVLGWDPHERLVDYLESAIASRKQA